MHHVHFADRHCFNKCPLLSQITAEFQAPSPLVALRKGLFLRHCKLHGEGLWAVVDISFEVPPNATTAKFRRRPSGCIIQQLQDDRSKVDQNLCSQSYYNLLTFSFLNPLPMAYRSYGLSTSRWKSKAFTTCTSPSSTLVLCLGQRDGWQRYQSNVREWLVSWPAIPLLIRVLMVFAIKIA